MVNEGISASSRYWDGKKIALTDSSKNYILKKAFRFDAELLFSDYGITGDDAVAFAKQSGVTEEQLLSDPDSYTFMAFRAINELEENASRETREKAVLALTSLGFTNIYESNTKNFILPPEEESPKQGEEQEQRQTPSPRASPSHFQKVRNASPTVADVPSETSPVAVSPMVQKVVVRSQPALPRQPSFASQNRPQLQNNIRVPISKPRINIERVARLRAGTPAPKFSIHKRFMLKK